MNEEERAEVLLTTGEILADMDFLIEKRADLKSDLIELAEELGYCLDKLEEDDNVGE